MSLKFSTRQRRRKYFRQRLSGNIAFLLILSVPIFPAFGQYMQTYTGVVVRGQYDSSTILASYDWGTGEDTSNLNWEPQLDTTPQTTLLDPSVGVDTPPEANTPAPPVITPVPQKDTIDPKKSLYVTHTVVSGDTLSTIAQKYGVPVSKIRETNELSGDILSLKQKILIPRINGVQYEVKSGDTLSEIAKKYGVADLHSIMLANDLKNVNLRIGRKLLIPNPTKDPTPKPKPVSSPTIAREPKPLSPLTPSVQPAPTNKPVTPSVKKDPATIAYGDYTLTLKTKSCRGFVWGNCTCFVAKYKDVTWRGNAKDWLKNAKKQGKSTGKEPKPGAIIVYYGPGFPPAYGHVGIVMSVDDDSMIIKDMNYRALNEVTTRIEMRDNPAIIGYIYVD